MAQNIKRTILAFQRAKERLIKADTELANHVSWRNNNADLARYTAMSHISLALEAINKFLEVEGNR